MSSRLRDYAERVLLEDDGAQAATLARALTGAGAGAFIPRQAEGAIMVGALEAHGELLTPEASRFEQPEVAFGKPALSDCSGGVSARPSLPERDLAAKRIFDLTFAFILLLILAPLMLTLCALVRVNSPGPAVFVQPRVGRHGRLFPCLKFRTMVVDAADQLEQLLERDPVAREEWERDQKLRNDVRVTSLGRFLRKTSLDELPQLFNILLGHMSVVGPRPIVVKEVDRYGIYFKDYCAVRPGLTGLWQVGGRNDVDYATRVAFDVEYARTWCLRSDLAICWKTVPALLLARGCY